MFQVTVTIGRNIGSVPMSARVWQIFQDEVTADIMTTLGSPALLEIRNGQSYWEGVREDSVIVVALYETVPTASELALLRHYLTASRNAFDQEAIALALGESELI